jgi:hypothetical protein
MCLDEEWYALIKIHRSRVSTLARYNRDATEYRHVEQMVGVSVTCVAVPFNGVRSPESGDWNSNGILDLV